jgi:hypothetical protein
MVIVKGLEIMKTIEEEKQYKELFDEYDSNTISVSDFNIVIGGTRVDYIHKGDNGDISIWAGNPDTDKFAEELLPDKAQKREVLELIWEYMF